MGQQVLGVKIEKNRDNGKVRLTQNGYLQKILQKFNINGDTKSVSTPLAPHFKLRAIMSPTRIEKHEYMSYVPYASALGNLIYAIVCTRPNLSQVTSMISRYMDDPRKGH